MMKKGFNVFVFVLALLLSSSFAYAAITDDLYQYLGFDSNESCSDLSLNSRDCIFVDNPSTVNGMINGAINITGRGDYINLTTNLATQDATINFLYYMGNETDGVIFGTLNNATPFNRLYIDEGGSTLRVITGSGSGATITNVAGGYTHTFDSWSMVTLVYDYNLGSPTYYLYLNSTLYKTIVETGRHSKNPYSLGALVNNNTIPSSYGKTQIFDEFAMWNRTLTGDEIFSLYTGYSNGERPFEVATNLNVLVYDRASGNLMSNNVTVYIENLINEVVENGNLTLPFAPIKVGNNILTASSDGYLSEQLNFEYEDETFTNLEVYLIEANESTLGNLIVQIFDDFDNYIIGADVILKEYDPSTGEFFQVSQCFSNSNGECIFNVELGVKFYIVEATRLLAGEEATGQSTTTGEIIKIDNTIIEIHLSTPSDVELEDDYDLEIIVSNTSLVGNTSYLSASFFDPNENSHTVCVGYYWRRGVNDIQLNETCVSGSSGTIGGAIAFALDRSITNVGKVYTKEGDYIKPYDEFVYPATDESSFDSAFTIFVKYFVLAFLLLLLALSLWTNNIGIFGGGAILISLVTPFLDPTLIGGVTAVFIALMGIIILVLANKRKQ